MPSGGLLTFWGLFLAYCLAPFALFAFLNRLFGRGSSCSGPALLACMGLGPLAVGWGLLALMAAMPGKPYSFHLWTISGTFLLLLAASEKSGAACAKELAAGMAKAARGAFGALRLWRRAETWLAALLLLFVGAGFVYLTILCAMLPPSGSDFIATLDLARRGYETATAHGDFSAHGGLALWSFIVQDSSAEAGAAKFIAPAFAFYILLLTAALPFRRLFDRAGAMALALLATTPSLCESSPLLVQTYSLTLALYALTVFIKERSRMAALICALAMASTLEFSTLPVCADAMQLPLALGLAAALATLGAMTGGVARAIMLSALIAALSVPLSEKAFAKAKEFPLAWDLPALPEQTIAAKSANGRFALFDKIQDVAPAGSRMLSPYPWDFEYYADGKNYRATSSANGALKPDYVCIPLSSQGDARLEKFMKSAKPLLPQKPNILIEVNGWRLIKL